MEPQRKASRHETYGGTSVNSIFIVTGPSAGALHIRSAIPSSETDLSVDDARHIIGECFDAVAVPVDQYWRAASHHHPMLYSSGVSSSSDGSKGGRALTMPSPLHAAVLIKRPDPRNIPSSFYSTRLDAVAQHHYETNQGLIVLAADKRNGSSGKLFNVLPKQELATFVKAIPLCYNRNLYALVDEDAAVDPFFDIDCHPPFDWQTEDEIVEKVVEKDDETHTCSSPSSLSSFSSNHATPGVVERWLGQILHFLRDKVETVTGARLQHCAVLTSSVLVSGRSGVSAGGDGSEKEDDKANNLLSESDSKISFHIHFRLDTNTAFANVRELHRFMMSLREELDESLSKPGAHETSCLHRMLLRCIDFGVYTRWRAFRLPYNVKALSPDVFCPLDAAGLDLMILAHNELHARATSIPDIRIGAAALTVVHQIDLSYIRDLASVSEGHERQQHRMLTKLFFFFRFFLPLVPTVTGIADGDLNAFLSAYSPYLLHDCGTEEERQQEIARVVFDMATVQRDNCAAVGGDRENTVTLRLVTMDSKTSGKGAVVSTRTTPCNPFFIPRPPHRDGVRVPIHDRRMKDLVAEVYRCLSAAYDGVRCNEGNGSLRVLPPITGEHIRVQYQDGIRAYYAQQKLSKFCLNQGREHRATYPQLYLTYGSIKLRCYSNDCHGSCLAVKWSIDNDDKRLTNGAAVQLLPVNELGYPKYERLSQICRLLFPPLPPEELLKRYGAMALEGLDGPAA